MAPQREPTLFDFSDMTDREFLDRAEKEIVTLLRHYAEKAANGRAFRRRLFSDDAARGFAFVDVCSKRFDVVLMNPPFGDPAIRSREYLAKQYPEGSHDICAAFVLGFAARLGSKGKLGAITTRLALFIQTFTAWRQLLLDQHHFRVVADLGYGVLDAMVETSMYTVGQQAQRNKSAIAFIGLLNSADKESSLDACLRDREVDWKPSRSFESVPGKPLAYWVPDSLLTRFRELASFNRRNGGIRQGIATGDDFRFSRLRWEVPAIHVLDKYTSKHSSMSPCWVPMSKGGEYAPWWDDIHLALNWHNNGSEVRNFYNERGKHLSLPQNIESFFLEGATFAYRTTITPDSAIEAAKKIEPGRIGYLANVTYGPGNRKPDHEESVIGDFPKYPPGLLLNKIGSPACPEDLSSNYPIRIEWDGILVDDPKHEDDIIRRVRDVMEVIWKDHAEAIEREACEILGVRELRDYFRKPGNDGFWMDHVKCYYNSRRKAPIYWYLRSGKGNYGIWLYYHRLDKDILFKALLNYVEPKIRLEEDRLNTLRSRKKAAGSSGREVKQLEKEIDRQEQFVSELHDFKDKLRCTADLRLVPDLNDGVVLNIALFWELVPWKEAQKYWEELNEGKYECSIIAYQLWPDRVREVCKRDRSITTAHGLAEGCYAPFGYDTPPGRRTGG